MPAQHLSPSCDRTRRSRYDRSAPNRPKHSVPPACWPWALQPSRGGRERGIVDVQRADAISRWSLGAISSRRRHENRGPAPADRRRSCLQAPLDGRSRQSARPCSPCGARATPESVEKRHRRRPYARLHRSSDPAPSAVWARTHGQGRPGAGVTPLMRPRLRNERPNTTLAASARNRHGWPKIESDDASSVIMPRRGARCYSPWAVYERRHAKTPPAARPRAIGDRAEVDGARLGQPVRARAERKRPVVSALGRFSKIEKSVFRSVRAELSLPFQTKPVIHGPVLL